MKLCYIYRKMYLFYINSIVICVLLTPIKLYSQQAEFISVNPFKDNYFIVNNGQYNDSVCFSVENATGKINIYKNGFEIILNKIESYQPKITDYLKSEEKRESLEKSGKKVKQNSIFWHMISENRKPDFSMINESPHYFSFGKKEYQSKGYEKLICKNVWEGIDIQYEIPEKGGFKYNFILHPGSDINAIKYTCTGNNTRLINLDSAILIQNEVNPLFDWIENVYNQENEKAAIHYQLNGDTILFQSINKLNPNQKWTIDPFVSTVSSLTSATTNSNLAYDVDYDNAGNVYVYGGGNGYYSAANNLKVAKYNPSGTLQWTFNGYISSINWSSQGNTGEIGNFYVQKSNGKVFVGNGYNPITGTVIIRLDSAGNYDGFKSTPNPNFSETWDMTFDCKSGKILAMGGSLTDNLNIGLIDTSNYTTVIRNFTGLSTKSQDIVASTSDPFGNLYVLFSSKTTTTLNNHICKVNSTYSGFLWNTATGFNTFIEAENKPFTVTNVLLNPYTSNGFNALAANSKYVFYFDGYYLKAFSCANGGSVGSSTIISGQSALYEGGIYVDECNTVYIGCAGGTVKVYKFNGTSFTFIKNILVSNISGHFVYDLKYNSLTNLLYVCGNQFVASVALSSTCVDTSSIPVILNSSCYGNAQVTLVNPDLSYTYGFTWIDTLTNAILRDIPYGAQTSDAISGLTPNKGYKLLVSKNMICTQSRSFIPFSIYPNALVNKTDSFCKNDTFYVGSKYKHVTAGTYTDTLKTVYGCDSIINLTLKFKRRDSIIINQVLCGGDSFQVANHWYKISGNYYDTLKNTSQCDSIIYSKITVNPRHNIFINPIICEGQSWKTGVHTYTLSGGFTDSLKNIFNCDSIVNTYLIVKPRTYFNQTQTICSNHAYTIGKNSYNKNGIYYDTLVNANNCDSVIRTQLIVLPFYQQNLLVSLCGNDTFYLGKYKHYSSGNYTDTLISSKGCDSIFYLNVAHHNVDSIHLDIQLCQGQKIQIGKHVYSSSGNYLDTIPNQFSCDSIISSTVYIYPTYSQTINKRMCNGQVYSFNGHLYSKSGLYYDTLHTVNSCDSIIITNLIIDPTYITDQYIRTCTKIPFVFNSHIYSSSGIYFDTLQSVRLCDSIIQTHLIVPDSINFWQNVYKCDSSNYTIGSHIYNKSGWYIDTLISPAGCDSIVYTNLEYIQSGMSIKRFPGGAIPSGVPVYIFVNRKHANDIIFKWKSIALEDINLVNDSTLKLYPTQSLCVNVSTKTVEGCVSSDSICMQVFYQDGLIVPNAFSPNKDGTNDVFHIWTNATILKIYSFKIYNRWGQVVFESNSPDLQWDGTYAGIPCPIETYFWTISFEDSIKGELYRSGTINLLR